MNMLKFSGELTVKLWLTFLLLFSATVTSFMMISSQSLSWRGRWEGEGEKERRGGGEEGGGGEGDGGVTVLLHHQ